MRLATTIFSLLVLFQCFGQSQPKMVAGPIVGHASETEINCWIMTSEVDSVRFELIDLKGNKIISSSHVPTLADYTKGKYHVKTLLTGNFPDSSYQLNVGMYHGEKTTIHLHPVNKTYKKDYSFLFGSCAYIGSGWSRIYKPINKTHIYKTMTRENAEHMLWMGDNIYLMFNHDMKNEKNINKRYVGIRKNKKFNRILSSHMLHYAIWDDHDFGPDNTDGTFENAHLTKKAFDHYWCNPTSPDSNAIYFTFTQGDIQYFMIDDRTYQIKEKQMLGEQQLNWLKESLKESTAPFKIIVMGSQVLNVVKGHESFGKFPKERNELFSFIKDEQIKGVVFFTGDRHHTEIQKLENDNFYPFYDITCSAMSSWRDPFRGCGKERKCDNRLPGTFHNKHNYGLASISGADGERKLLIQIKSKRGKVLSQLELKMSDLGY